MLQKNQFSLQLVEKHSVSASSLELCFRRPDNGIITYVPGQFFSFHLPEAAANKTRSYSVANRCHNIRENRELRITATLIEGGHASEFFRQAEIGVEVSASGPFGNLILPPQDPARYLLIATGAGVAPYRAMLPQLSERLKAKPELQVVLLLGVQNPAELLYADEFRQMADEHDNFCFRACYSQAEAAAEDEVRGYVQTQFADLQPNTEHDRVYLCGNPAMVDDAVKQLTPLGFTPANLKREKYLFSRL
ncbi:ferredoxin--NADP reductase [Pontibacter sp. JAM-7]|uniref:ferredoxin--NADP reductase n=1 Tax=Pontibacter sp. JAM-7 TaxID=3366581 RepID=UPI003AF5FB75